MKSFAELLEEQKKERAEQDRLKEYQRTRSLPVPPTTGIRVALVCAGIGLFFTVAAGALILAPIGLPYKLLGGLVLSAAFVEGALRLIAIKAVECYQHYASEETRRRCMCVPSCSEYAILCLKKYETVKALMKIRRRLNVTCNRFDYLLDPP